MKESLQRLEHIPGLAVVDAYLKKHTHLASLDLTALEEPHPSLETSLSAENILMLDLEQAKAQGTSTIPMTGAGLGQEAIEPTRASTLNDLRNYIRAVSWMTHRQLNEKTDIPDLASIRELLGLPLDEAADRTIERAIKNYTCGEEMEEAVLAVEEIMMRAWEWYRAVSPDPQKKHEAEQLIQVLRPIRDQLYYQREYPTLCRIAAEKKEDATDPDTIE
jgi:hypothetical protein